ncbi:glycosyl hydrolase [Nibricoccus aquaticus]|uniref:Glycosyl hydrolase n=1 Tax=Nibricoccus aquaticus TaxID=2576891 RepID=A0A290QC34_9BACT|nr:glycoside hydrolase family 88 protein [Nibricoccus aquaticus]ATC65817.1 glycosyl hydrolase [Nibricoccus aquaticus]
MIKTLFKPSLLLSALLCLVSTEVRAGFDFGPYPAGASPEEVGKRVTQRFIGNDYRTFGKTGILHYVETCTWYGALTFAQRSNNIDLTAQLVARYQPLFGERAKAVPPPFNVDYSIFGALPLELFIQTRDARYLTPGLYQADQQWGLHSGQVTLSPEAQEAISKGLSWHTRLWIDDMYMITMLQTQAYRATGDRKYLDRAADEAVYYLERLQQPNGLFHHAPDVPFFWSRGNGWFAAGMSELLLRLPPQHPQRASILASYQKMMAALLKYQSEDGMWRQLIDGPDSWKESSGTGMFTFAFITGVKNGWLDAETYGPAARKGWLALVGQINPDGAVRDVCEGTNKKNDRQYYLDRLRIVGDLHGQAPVLWCATALLR